MQKAKNYIFSILIIIFLVIGNIGKTQVILNGFVRDNSTLIGVPNRVVTIFADTSFQPGFTYSSIDTTNNLGAFTDTINIPTGLNYKFYIVTLDCYQNPIIDSCYSLFQAIINLDICTNGLNMCLSDYVAYPDTSNFQMIRFYNISSSNATSYLWDFGDGGFAAAKHPTHTYNLGTYQACLTIYDSLTNCSDTYCDSISMTPLMNCSNSFTYQQITAKLFSFSGNVNSAYPTIYNWDFGDMTTANGKNIQHQYAQPGNYTVSLMSTSFHPQTLDTCIDFSQQNIIVTGPPTAGVWGQVFADSSKVDHGMVYIYSYKNANHELTLVDSTDVLSIDSIGISYYHFAGLDYDKYVIYLKLRPNSSFKDSHAPAYSGNTLYWNEAQVSHLNQASTNVPINLTHIYSSTGNSSISGFVYEGNKVIPGDPINNVPIYLLDQNKMVVDFQYSNQNGKYKFENISEQKYYIYADVVNHNISPSTCTVSELNQHHTNINIYISPGAVTGINSETIANNFNIYPNPAQDLLNISFNNYKSQNIEYHLINILGQTVLHNVQSSEGQNQAQVYNLDITNLEAGIYILQIKISDKLLHNQKLIITK